MLFNQLLTKLGNIKINYMAKKGPQELNPPTTLAGKFGQWMVDQVEDIISARARHGDVPVYDANLFPWVQAIEAEAHLIQEELAHVLKRRDELPAFHEITSELPPLHKTKPGRPLFSGYGAKCQPNIDACPNTNRLLQMIPGMKTAFFSILDPGKYIPAHRGPYNGVLRYHLGLRIPKQRKQCKIRIDQEICHWSEGKSIIFDDSFDHEVWNETDEERVVLFVDFIRPCKFPANVINKALLASAGLMPFVREARKHRGLGETLLWNE